MTMEVTNLIKPEASWCEANNCSNNTIDTPDKTFLKFPRDRKRCKEWLTKTAKQELMHKTTQYLHKNCKLCSDHFLDEMFRWNRRDTGLLQPYAVPTIFSFAKNNNKQATITSTPSPTQTVDASLSPVVLLKRLKLSDYHVAHNDIETDTASEDEHAIITSVQNKDEKCDTTKSHEDKKLSEMMTSDALKDVPSTKAQVKRKRNPENRSGSSATMNHVPTMVQQRNTETEVSMYPNASKQSKVSNATKHVPLLIQQRKAQALKDKQSMVLHTTKHVPSVVQQRKAKASKYPNASKQSNVSNVTKRVPSLIQQCKAQASKDKQLMVLNTTKRVPSVVQQRKAKASKYPNASKQSNVSNATKHVPSLIQQRKAQALKDKQLMVLHTTKYVPSFVQQRKAKSVKDEHLMMSNVSKHVPSAKPKHKRNRNTENKQSSSSSTMNHLPTMMQQWNTEAARPDEKHPQSMLESLNVTDVTEAILRTIDIQKSLQGIGPYCSQENLLQRIAIQASQVRPPNAAQKTSTSARSNGHSYFESFVTEEDIRRQEERVKRARHKLELALKHSDQLQHQELAIAS